jgi:hypothetical protein
MERFRGLGSSRRDTTHPPDKGESPGRYAHNDRALPTDRPTKVEDCGQSGEPRYLRNVRCFGASCRRVNLSSFPATAADTNQRENHDSAPRMHPHVRDHGDYWRIAGPRLYSKSETPTKLGTSWHDFRSSMLRWSTGIIQAAITTAVATAIATHQLTDFHMRFVEEWLFAWGLAFLTMLPVVVFVSPSFSAVSWL